MNKMEQKYRNARANLLLMAILTVLNIILLVTESSISFPFSAVIPQISAIWGIIWLGMEQTVPAILGIAVAVICLAAYFLCYFFSKKHYGWMIAALCLFSLDSLACLYYTLKDFDAAYLIDIAFHGWVMYYLIIGVINGARLRQSPAAETEETAEPQDLQNP